MKIKINKDNQNSFILILAISIISINLLSCRKDPEVIIPEVPEVVDDSVYCECTPIPPGPIIGYSYSYQPNYYVYASFNPNNDDEIVYFDLTAVYKYNLVTKVKTMLYQGQITSELNWGINDWIVFRDNGLWKVKSDGSNLSFIPNSNLYYGPKWNNNATKMICIDKNIHKVVLIDINGIVLDTLENVGVSYSSSWNHPQYLFRGVFNQIAIINNPLTDEVVYNFPIENSFDTYTGCLTSITQSGGGVWVNNEVYYSNSLGIFKLNLLGESELVKQVCNTEYFTSPTLNQSKTKILWIRNESIYIDEFTLEAAKQLYVMSLDGTMEQIIID
jgi:hypothetical protein